MVAVSEMTTFTTTICVESLIFIFSLLMIATAKFPKLRIILGLGIRQGSVPLFSCIVFHSIMAVIQSGLIVNTVLKTNVEDCAWSLKISSIAYSFELLGFFAFLYLKSQSLNSLGKI